VIERYDYIEIGEVFKNKHLLFQIAIRNGNT